MRRSVCPSRRACFALALLCTLAACGKDAPAAAPPAPEPAAAAPLQAAPQQAAPLASEACGQILVVAFRGAYQAAGTVTRNKPQARIRAAELLGKLNAGADFATLARAESDAPTSAARGGIMGTFEKDAWPEVHEAIKEPLFALEVGQLASEPIEADYGVTLLRRCAVEKARSRHVLVRYAGAKKANGDTKRTKEQARDFAEQCLVRLGKGEDFAAVATACSDDGSKERGGDIGLVGRGLLAPAYEATLFSLQPGERSAVVETDFGFHIIERLAD